MKPLKLAGITGVVLYFAAMGALYIFQRSVLYIPPNVYLSPAGVKLPEAQEVYSPETPSDLLGWWLPPTDSSFPSVIFFHGNGSAVFSNYDIYRTLNANGYGVFAVAYPGYPGRSGAPTQNSLTEAAMQAYEYVSDKNIGADKIVYYGTSLGAGVAAQLAARKTPALIFMEAPFTSAADMAQYRFPIFPAALLTKDKFFSGRALARKNIRMVWIHGTQDYVIPLEIGQQLYDGYDGPKTAHIIEGGEHINLWYRGGDQIIMTALDTLRTKENAR